MRPAGLMLLLAAALWSSNADALVAGDPLVVEPQQVGIGLFYSGATVKVRAEIPVGYRAAVRLMGHPERLELKKLGKKGGILWMPVGDVAFENVPVIYQVLTSAPLRELGPPAVLAQWSLGYDSLIPANPPGAALRSELVTLKEHQGLFVIREGGLVRQAQDARPTGAQAAGVRGAGGAPAVIEPRPTELLRGSFRLPPRVPPGDYSVDLIGFNKQGAVHLGSAMLQLKRVGAVSAMRRLAMDHGLLYGIAASVIAILVGLLTGLVFQPKSDESH
jgi:Putative transmembrane protein (Alph_Pro_TM)